MSVSPLDCRPRVCYEVEKVIGISSEGNVRTYHVQWSPSWVSGHHLVGCEHLIQQYLEQQHREEIKQSKQHEKQQRQQKFLEEQQQLLEEQKQMLQQQQEQQQQQQQKQQQNVNQKNERYKQQQQSQQRRRQREANLKKQHFGQQRLHKQQQHEQLMLKLQQQLQQQQQFQQQLQHNSNLTREGLKSFLQDRRDTLTDTLTNTSKLPKNTSSAPKESILNNILTRAMEKRKGGELNERNSKEGGSSHKTVGSNEDHSANTLPTVTIKPEPIGVDYPETVDTITSLPTNDEGAAAEESDPSSKYSLLCKDQDAAINSSSKSSPTYKDQEGAIDTESKSSMTYDYQESDGTTSSIVVVFNAEPEAEPELETKETKDSSNHVDEDEVELLDEEDDDPVDDDKDDEDYDPAQDIDESDVDDIINHNMDYQKKSKHIKNDNKTKDMKHENTPQVNYQTQHIDNEHGGTSVVHKGKVIGEIVYEDVPVSDDDEEYEDDEEESMDEEEVEPGEISNGEGDEVENNSNKNNDDNNINNNAVVVVKSEVFPDTTPSAIQVIKIEDPEEDVAQNFHDNNDNNNDNNTHTPPATNTTRLREWRGGFSPPRHLRVGISPVGDCRYACESCGKWCHSREDLVEHNVTHAKEKPYQCQHCHVWFPRTNMLVEHITTTHADEIQQDKERWEARKRRRTGEVVENMSVRHKCQQCDLSFNNSTELNTHVQQHINDKPYVCDVCHAAFKNYPTFVKHIQSPHP